MAKHVDTEDMEITTAMKFCSFDGKSILEIGCGDGRLSLRYADRARRVIAIDPIAESIEIAKRNLPKRFRSRLAFRVGRGEELGDYQAGSFEIVFFTWSLCCTDIPVMGKAIDEAWRVLRRNGLLINLQPSLYQPFDQGALAYLVKKKFGTSVDDDRYRQSRLALKYKSLIERRFDFVAEEEFPVKTIYDTVQDATEDLATGAREQYDSLTKSKKERICQDLKSRMTANGIAVIENALLTVVRRHEE